MKFEDSFRGYQTAAIRLSTDYINRHKISDATGAALVCHPTGTGKTAVIAGVSQCIEEIGTSLILCTRQAIRDQLSDELSGNLYLEKFQVDDIPRKPVILIKGSSDFEKNAKSLISNQIKGLEPRVIKAVCEKVLANIDPHQKVSDLVKNKKITLIMTVQLLSDLDRKKSDKLELLKKYVDLVIFDEGHYEPAIKWSESIRYIRVRRIF